MGGNCVLFIFVQHLLTTKFNNTMKVFRLFGIIMMLVMGMAFTACSDDDDNNGDGGRYPLTGTWIGEEDGEQFMYVFNGDGSGYGSYVGSNNPDYFTDYKVTDGVLCIRWEGDDDYDEKGHIEISGNSFRIRWYDEGDWITFYKQ